MAEGETAMEPPEAGTLYLEPSEPETLTVVAFVAVMVSVSDDPAVIVPDFAVIETVGAAFSPFTVIVVWAVVLPWELVAVAV